MIQTERIATVALLIVQFVGLALSAALLVLAFSNPKQIEERLRSFIMSEVDRAAETVWADAFLGSTDSSRAERFSEMSRFLARGATALEEERQRVVPAILAISQKSKCVDSCNFWARAAEIVDDALLMQIAQVRVGQSNLQAFLEGEYDATLNGLLTDLKRVGAVNVIVFALMIGLLLHRKMLDWRFAVFSIALTGYALMATYDYLFGQSWALTLILNDWAGPSYQYAMAFTACLFLDWLFLAGFITQMVLAAIVSCFQ